MAYIDDNTLKLINMLYKEGRSLKNCADLFGVSEKELYKCFEEGQKEEYNKYTDFANKIIKNEALHNFYAKQNPI